MQVVKERIKTVRDKEGRREDCEGQLRRLCKNIADDISDPLKKEDRETIEVCPASDFMEGVYDIEWITYNDKSYKAARLLVAGGGPNIWVNLQTNTVDGYWGCDKVTWGFVDNIGLDEYLEELHACA